MKWMVIRTYFANLEADLNYYTRHGWDVFKIGEEGRNGYVPVVFRRSDM